MCHLSLSLAGTHMHYTKSLLCCLMHLLNKHGTIHFHLYKNLHVTSVLFYLMVSCFVGVMLCQWCSPERRAFSYDGVSKWKGSLSQVELCYCDSAVSSGSFTLGVHYWRLTAPASQMALLFFSSRDWETSQDWGKAERSKVQRGPSWKPAQDLRLGRRFTFQQDNDPKQKGQDNAGVSSGQVFECPWVVQPEPRLEPDQTSLERPENSCAAMLPIQP